MPGSPGSPGSQGPPGPQGPAGPPGLPGSTERNWKQCVYKHLVEGKDKGLIVVSLEWEIIRNCKLMIYNHLSERSRAQKEERHKRDNIDKKINQLHIQTEIKTNKPSIWVGRHYKRKMNE